MNYYIVSEEELEQLIKTAMHEAKAPALVSGVALSFASAACRARPVPDQATHFAQIQDQGEPLLDLWEIKR